MFEIGTNIDIAQVDVQNRVGRANKSLPAEVINYGITVKKSAPDMLMVLTLYSPDRTYDDLFLSNYARLNLMDPIARIYGVGDTKLVGEREYAMRMWVRPDKLAKLNLTASDIVNAIKDQNVQAPAGQVGQPPAAAGVSFQYSVDVKGRLNEKEEFDNVIVRTESGGSMLRVKDVARTEVGAKMYTSFGRRGGSPAAVMIIYQLPGANALEVAKKIQDLMKESSKTFPPGLEYEVSYDNTLFVTAALEEVLHTLLEAVILVVLVVFLFLGNFRATFIPMLAVPVSLIGTFAAFAMMGFSINTLTMFGLVLAIGIVVDDAIVVVEAVEHHIEHGMTPLEATKQAMVEVSGPVVGIAMVLISVFVPVTFLGGITGQLYRQFAMTLSISVALSAIVALSLTPALCVMLLRPRKKMRGPLGWLIGGFNKGFDWSTKGYVSVVKILTRRTIIGLALLAAVYYGAFHFVSVIPGGFVPEEDPGVIFTTFFLPDGSSMDRTDEVMKRAEKYAKELHGVKTVITMGGFNLMNGANTSNIGSLILTLEPWDERKAPELGINALSAKLRGEFGTYPEAMAVVYTLPPVPGMGNVNGQQFELQDRGSHTIADLANVSREFATKAAALPEIALAFNTFKADVPQVKLEIDRDKVKALGIPLKTVFDSLQIYLGGFMINDFNRFGRTYKVMAQAEPDFRASPDNIGSIYVRTASDKMIPLSNLVKVGSKTGPDLIRRHNIYRTAEINIAPAPGFSSGDGMGAIARPRREGASRGLRLRVERARVPGEEVRGPGADDLRNGHGLRVPGARRPVRELGHPVRHHLRAAHRGLRRLPRSLDAGAGQRRLRPDRPRHAPRPRRQERDPDRRVREDEAREGGDVDRRRGDRGLEAPVPSDPHDVVRVHPGRHPAHDRDRRRVGLPLVARDGGVRGHDRGDGHRRVPRPGALRRDREPGGEDVRIEEGRGRFLRTLRAVRSRW